MVKLVQNSIRSTKQSIAYSPCYAFVLMKHNVWCYVQVCLVKTFNLAQNLMANLHIARVSSRFLFTNLI